MQDPLRLPTEFEVKRHVRHVAARGSAPSEARHPRAWVRSGVARVGIRADPSPTTQGGDAARCAAAVAILYREVRVSSQAASKRATKETGECQRSWRERSSAPPERASPPKRIPSPPLTVISVEPGIWRIQAGRTLPDVVAAPAGVQHTGERRELFRIGSTAVGNVDSCRG